MASAMSTAPGGSIASKCLAETLSNRSAEPVIRYGRRTGRSGVPGTHVTIGSRRKARIPIVVTCKNSKSRWPGPRCRRSWPPRRAASARRIRCFSRSAARSSRSFPARRRSPSRPSWRWRCSSRPCCSMPPTTPRRGTSGTTGRRSPAWSSSPSASRPSPSPWSRAR